MAHFLLYFRFSGFRSSFFPLFQPIFFPLFGALGREPLSFPDFLSFCRQHMARFRPAALPSLIPSVLCYSLFLCVLPRLLRPSRIFRRAIFRECTGKPPRLLPSASFFCLRPPSFSRKRPDLCRAPAECPLRRVLSRGGAISPAGRLFIPRRGQSLSEAFFCGFCHFPPQGILPPLPGHTFYIRRKL